MYHLMNKIAEVRQSLSGAGNGLFAKVNIPAGTVIHDWEIDGMIYRASDVFDLPQLVLNYAIQCGQNEWIDTYGVGRFANHSCSPNVGFKGQFQMIAMRLILEGEEITSDYGMTERSGWRVKNCFCESANCRKENVGNYDEIPPELRSKYKGFISTWIEPL